jgi:hypothetical protein
MKQPDTYMGHRTPTGCVVVVQDDQGNKRPLPPRNDLDNHSPDGFEWGYAGSGPAQLALAILADALGSDEWAVRLHQHFKRDFIQNLPQDDAEGWAIDADEVRRWAVHEGGSN